MLSTVPRTRMSFYFVEEFRSGDNVDVFWYLIFVLNLTEHVINTCIFKGRSLFIRYFPQSYFFFLFNEMAILLKCNAIQSKEVSCKIFYLFIFFVFIYNIIKWTPLSHREKETLHSRISHVQARAHLTPSIVPALAKLCNSYDV
jgi:hypothetical protein